MSKDNSKMSDVISGDTVDIQSCRRCFICTKEECEQIGKLLGDNGIFSSHETTNEQEYCTICSNSRWNLLLSHQCLTCIIVNISMGSSPFIRKLDTMMRFRYKDTCNKLLKTFLDNSTETNAVSYSYLDSPMNISMIAVVSLTKQYASKIDFLTSEVFWKQG